MGIFGNDEGHEEIDLDKELAGVGESEATAPDGAREEPPAELDALQPVAGLVSVHVIAAHNGLRRGDSISVTPERAEQMVASGVGEVRG